MADSRDSLAVVVPLFGGRRPVVGEKRLTKRELGAHFRVTPRTIERWMGKGLPFDKPFPGAQVTFVLSECEAWYRGDAA